MWAEKVASYSERLATDTGSKFRDPTVLDIRLVRTFSNRYASHTLSGKFGWFLWATKAGDIVNPDSSDPLLHSLDRQHVRPLPKLKPRAESDQSAADCGQSPPIRASGGQSQPIRAGRLSRRTQQWSEHQLVTTSELCRVYVHTHTRHTYTHIPAASLARSAPGDTPTRWAATERPAHKNRAATRPEIIANPAHVEIQISIPATHISTLSCTEHNITNKRTVTDRTGCVWLARDWTPHQPRQYKTSVYLHRRSREQPTAAGRSAQLGATRPRPPARAGR